MLIEPATEWAVDTAIRSALRNLGHRIVVPPRPSLCSLEINACVRLLLTGESVSNSEGSLVLFLLVRCPDCRVRDPEGLCLNAARLAWETDEPGAGVAMENGYHGWVGPIPGAWLDRVSC